MLRRQHSGLQATTHRYTMRQQSSIGMGGPGDRGLIGENNSSMGGRKDVAKEIMERHLAQMKKGLKEVSVGKWSK